jgi:predicted transcriptional regulator of viral defense system
MEFLAALQGVHGVFTLNDAERITGKRGKYASLFLGRLCGRGTVRRIERGRYYLPGSSVYAVASSIVQPSYISLLAAFRYHGITTQNVAVIDVMATKRHGMIDNIEGSVVHFTRLAGSRFFGFYIDKDTGTSVAHVEKALVDALHLGSPPYAYVEEAFMMAAESGKLDRRRMERFASQMRSKRVTEGIALLKAARGRKARVFA